MTRIINYTQQIQKYGSDAAFVANLIVTRHRKPATKLYNLLYLLNTGRHVRTGACDSDTLLVDGRVIPWSTLDSLNAALDIVNPRL